MTDRELLQMALDALKDWDSLIKHQYNGSREAMSDLTVCAQSTPPIIEALCAALAQPEEEEDYDAIANKQLASLKAAAKVTFEDAVVRAVHKLYNAPSQREVYCGCGDEIVAGDGARCGTCVAVKYKEKEWVGFTQEEHQAAMRTDGSFGAGFLYAEKLLKEKNNG